MMMHHLLLLLVLLLLYYKNLVLLLLLAGGHCGSMLLLLGTDGARRTVCRAVMQRANPLDTIRMAGPVCDNLLATSHLNMGGSLGPVSCMMLVVLVMRINTICGPVTGGQVGSLRDHCVLVMITGHTGRGCGRDSILSAGTIDAADLVVMMMLMVLTMTLVITI